MESPNAYREMRKKCDELRLFTGVEAVRYIHRHFPAEGRTIREINARSNKILRYKQYKDHTINNGIVGRGRKYYYSQKMLQAIIKGWETTPDSPRWETIIMSKYGS